MTEQEVREGIESSLGGSAGENIPPAVLKIDYRKLEARFLCTGKDNQIVCLRNKVESYVCPFHGEDGQCLWSE